LGGNYTKNPQGKTDRERGGKNARGFIMTTKVQKGSE